VSRSVHFYDAVTGVFTGRSFTVSEDAGGMHAAAVKANTPAGLAAFEGDCDPATQRVDTASGQLVPYQPPPPTPEQVAKARRRRSMPTMAQIHALEVSQARVLREAVLGDNAALQRLRTIDEAIIKLRSEL
jgi:hypothetical protein